MILTQKEKRKIAARLFYSDNQDQYDDYREAVIEFQDQNKLSDKFIDFSVQDIIKQKDGHLILYHDKTGHVASFRLEDGFFSPITEITEEEVEAFENEFKKEFNLIDENNEIEAFKKAGWEAIDD